VDAARGEQERPCEARWRRNGRGAGIVGINFSPSRSLP